MPDYECHPLWCHGHGGEVNVSPHDPVLGLSSGLATDLEQWGDEFDATLNRDDPASSGFPTPQVADQFAERGVLLSRRLREELASDWVVSYFDIRVRRASPVD
ncbi:hypothetical protein [Longispora fulva]|uniref:Uncharacterized protein n=1 Tax=Longispora fulva TaxID=619741 RepID=A0A8J7KPK5_9ACTN|nr:hypothetical protein [Longispora fulva]MBG6136407.1 hypothetical protein [Longispora fulva]